MKVFLLFALMLSGLFLTAGQGLTNTSARSVSMANAVIASPSNESLFSNQAGLAGIRDFLITVTYESKYGLNEYSTMALGTVIPFAKGTAGISFTQFGRKLYRISKTGIAYSRNFGESVAAALQFDVLSESFPENSLPFMTMTVEMGMITIISPIVKVGFHLCNPFSYTKSAIVSMHRRPSVFRCGVAWIISNELNYFGEIEKMSGNLPCIKTGIEFSALGAFKLRAGVQGVDLQPSAGFGFINDRLIVDMGFSYHGNLGFSPIITLNYCL